MTRQQLIDKYSNELLGMVLKPIGRADSSKFEMAQNIKDNIKRIDEIIGEIYDTCFGVEAERSPTRSPPPPAPPAAKPAGPTLPPKKAP